VITERAAAALARAETTHVLGLLVADVPIVVLTSKEMTPADQERLAGRISFLAQKGTVGGAELVELVGRLAGGRPSPLEETT